MASETQEPFLQTRTQRTRQPSYVAEADISAGSIRLQDLPPGGSETTLRPSTGLNDDGGRNNSLSPDANPGTPQASHGDDLFADPSTPNLPTGVHNGRCAILRHRFDAHRQFWELIKRGLIKFMFTLGLATILVFTIHIFSSKDVLNKQWKRWFNTINTGISLALGMSVASGLKSMVGDLRWFILSRKKRPLSLIDLILRSDSLAVMLQLVWVTVLRKVFFPKGPKRDWMLGLTYFSLLMVNLAAQIAVATVALNYSTEQNKATALLEHGTILLPDLGQIHPVSARAQNSTRAQQYTANSFGRVASSFKTNDTTTIPAPGTFSNTGARLFLAGDSRSWVYVFLDSSPAGVAVYTNRTINSTWSCQRSTVSSGGNGDMSYITIPNKTKDGTSTVQLPISGGPNQTTFFTDPDMECGPGCTTIEAFEASEPSWYYYCNITVGIVENISIPEQQVSLSLRHMASAGIALQGYGLPSTIQGVKQAQIYASESLYGEPQNGDAENLGLLIARFSIGVVAVASNPFVPNNITVPGMRPKVGSRLAVENWVFIWLIMGLLVGVQGAAFVFTAFWANRVVVKDPSFLSVSRLFKPFIEKLENCGTAARGKEICQVLDDEPDSEVIYAFTTGTHDGVKIHQLELGSFERERTFPEGIYD